MPEDLNTIYPETFTVLHVKERFDIRGDNNVKKLNKAVTENDPPSPAICEIVPRNKTVRDDDQLILVGVVISLKMFVYKTSA